MAACTRTLDRRPQDTWSSLSVAADCRLVFYLFGAIPIQAASPSATHSPAPIQKVLGSPTTRSRRSKCDVALCALKSWSAIYCRVPPEQSCDTQGRSLLAGNRVRSGLLPATAPPRSLAFQP